MTKEKRKEEIYWRTQFRILTFGMLIIVGLLMFVIIKGGCA